MSALVYTITIALCLTQLKNLNGECNVGELERYVYCSSTATGGAAVFCPSGITIINSFTLDQQNYTEECNSGEHTYYGTAYGNRVWVQNGCDAVFIVCGCNAVCTTISESVITSTPSTNAQTVEDRSSLPTSHSTKTSTTTQDDQTTETIQLTTITTDATQLTLIEISTTYETTMTVTYAASTTITNDTNASTLTSRLSSAFAIPGATGYSSATLSTGAIAGIVSGGLLLIVIVCIAFVCALKSDINDDTTNGVV